MLRLGAARLATERRTLLRLPRFFRREIRDAGRISVAIVDDYAGIAEAMKRLRVERATSAADVTVRAGRTSLRQSSLLADLLQRRGIKLPREQRIAPAGHGLD